MSRELDLMKIPMASETVSGMVYWPVFLLAYKVGCVYLNSVNCFFFFLFSLVNGSSYLH